MAEHDRNNPKRAASSESQSADYRDASSACEPRRAHRCCPDAATPLAFASAPLHFIAHEAHKAVVGFVANRDVCRVRYRQEPNEPQGPLVVLS